MNQSELLFIDTVSKSCDRYSTGIYKKILIIHCLYSSVNKVKYSTALSAAISQTFTVENTHLQTFHLSTQQMKRSIKIHTDCSLEVLIITKL